MLLNVVFVMDGFIFGSFCSYVFIFYLYLNENQQKSYMIIALHIGGKREFGNIPRGAMTLNEAQWTHFGKHRLCILFIELLQTIRGI